MADRGGWRTPRPCEAYRAEWQLCRSAGHFLHHYYVHGERPACEQWRRDLDSCREWKDRRSTEAQAFKSTIQKCFPPPMRHNEKRTQPKPTDPFPSPGVNCR
ncbi:UPF0545 protein C22orf39 homolog isoform X2 [Molossus molossus]|uniref:UPF0545 protein C22orf39 homolog isoform X2 n=1 Tax=Molossus molossus TaxID=27622 RepID=UPI001747C1C0|nr:UPF0545 protein C22orf39 homolog isoform X2 [Molossus molossus]